MAERVTRITPDGVAEHTRYTKNEIRMIWDAAKTKAHSATRIHQVQQISEESALELTAIWLRQYCSDTSTISYNAEYGNLNIYYDHIPNAQGILEAWRRQVRAYEYVGADERGPLFADEGSREINPLPLLKFIQESLMAGAFEEHMPEAYLEMEKALEAAYGR